MKKKSFEKMVLALLLTGTLFFMGCNRETGKDDSGMADEGEGKNGVAENEQQSSWGIGNDKQEFVLSGRWFEKEIQGQKAWVTLNDGAMIYFKTEGTDNLDVHFLEITALETPYYAYIIDEGEPVRQLITESHIALPDDKEHRITIVVDGMTEFEDKWNGEIGVAFTGVDCHNGEITGFIPEKKRILFVGDSITEGVLVLNNEANSNGNSATHSFPWYTARLLDAEPYFIGYGATGIFMTGSFSRCADMLDYLSASRPVSKEEIPACDLAVINMGTNDHEVNGEMFVHGYREILLKLHDRYPQIKIFCMIPFTQLHNEDIRRAAEEYPWCVVVETAEWNITYTDGIHPDAAGAEQIGERLAEVIREEGDWQSGME